jgi:hypothetical protein
LKEASRFVIRALGHQPVKMTPNYIIHFTALQRNLIHVFHHA